MGASVFPEKINTKLLGPMIPRILFITQAKGHLAKRGDLSEREAGQASLRDEVVVKELWRKGPLRGSLGSQELLECLHLPWSTPQSRSRGPSPSAQEDKFNLIH